MEPPTSVHLAQSEDGKSSRPDQNLLKTGSKSEEIKGINNLYEFGPFRLDPARHLLLRGEEPVSLTPKAFETLLLLVENRDRVLLKDELMNRLWPESFVEEANLSQTIFMLRKTLGETAQDQRYIVTVRGGKREWHIPADWHNR
jgi:DNA-binding response OmpR family regulator